MLMNATFSVIVIHRGIFFFPFVIKVRWLLYAWGLQYVSRRYIPSFFVCINYSSVESRTHLLWVKMNAFLSIHRYLEYMASKIAQSGNWKISILYSCMCNVNRLGFLASFWHFPRFSTELWVIDSWANCVAITASNTIKWFIAWTI